MTICFFPLNVDGAGCYRCIFPMAYLGQRGHVASMPGLVLSQHGRRVMPLPGAGLLERIPPGDFDVSYVEDSLPEVFETAVFQLGSMGWQVEWARELQRKGVAIVLDLDDDLHRSPKYNPARLDPDWSPANNRRNTQRMCELADLVTCATPSLAEFYSRWNRNVVVLRNRLHWPMWEHIDRGAGWRRFRVGYMGNTDFHGEDLRLIAPTLRKWLIAHPEVEFVAAGDPRMHDLIGVPPAQRVSTMKVWYRNLDLPQITATFDVGLVPLIRNDFNEGKSALKGMEYAAAGIPCIATPTGEYQWWVKPGENGFLAKHPRDFVDALDAVLADPGLLSRLGAGARTDARASSLDNHIQDWERAYAGIGHGHHTNDIGAGVAA